MIHRPIYLSCDACGVERVPTPGESRETLARAFARARDEGWAIRRNGETIYCDHCMGVEADVSVDIEVDVEVGVVGLKIVSLN